MKSIVCVVKKRGKKKKSLIVAPAEYLCSSFIDSSLQFLHLLLSFLLLLLSLDHLYNTIDAYILVYYYYRLLLLLEYYSYSSVIILGI